MKKYVIESPHTREECLRALDEELAKGPQILEQFNYGCMSGDHTAYAIVDARDEKEARNLVPAFLLNSARIIEVGKFTPEVIKSFHTIAA
jgi:hypothetical protein